MRSQEGEQCPGQQTASMTQRVWQKTVFPLLAALVSRMSPWSHVAHFGPPGAKSSFFQIPSDFVVKLQVIDIIVVIISPIW